MSFSNLFRRHSGLNEGQAANYACSDANSTVETLLDELEMQCRVISMPKRNSSAMEKTADGLLTVNSSSSASSKRHSSVDYSWLSPQTNLLQVKNESYYLPDIIKMELNELIRNVLPEDCTCVINQFRRRVRATAKGTSPENVIAVFRATIADYIDEKSSTSNENCKSNDSHPCRLNKLGRNHRVLPKYPSEDEQQQQQQHSIAELTQISLTSSINDGTDVKPRSNTCI